MTQADSVHSTPPTNTSALPASDPQSQARVAGELYFRTPVTPEEIFQAIGRLRKEARDEIERLLNFLDETDNHMEREPDGDEDDASFPESGSRACNPMEDDEDAGDDEPSLGSSGHGSGGLISYTHTAISDGFQMVVDCEGDEHDGREPEDEGGEAVKEDDEPSLGWTDEEAARGRASGSMGRMADLEEGTGAVPPQNRTSIAGPQISATADYRKWLHGLTPAQRLTFRSRMRSSTAGTEVALR